MSHWLRPRTEPAPLISRSFIAILNPEPKRVNSLIASSRLVAISLSTLPRLKVKYVCTAICTSDTASELVELGKSHTIRILNDKAVAVGAIYTGFG